MLSVHRYHDVSTSTHANLKPLSLHGAAFDPKGGIFDIGTSWIGCRPVGTLDMVPPVAADNAQAQNV